MEIQPCKSPDDDPRGPDQERLERGEIDLTGTTRQDDDLKDVINDALVEASTGEGRIPEWGAQSLARALANRLDDPLSGALHHFAVTGRADTEAMVEELLGIYQKTTDEETLQWIEYLGVYLTSLPEAATPEQSHPEQPPQTQPPGELPTQRGRLEKVSAYLRIKFAGADARGEAISEEDAQILAFALASLPERPDSELERYAHTGDADPTAMFEESEQLKSREWKSRVDIPDWIERFQRHLATRTDLDRQAKPSTAVAPADNPQVAEGLREHGDAFRAFLHLPDLDPNRRDLLDAFREFYDGVYASMSDLIDARTEIRACMEAAKDVAERWGFEDLITFDQAKLETRTREVWDIIEFDGRFYVFQK